MEFPILDNELVRMELGLDESDTLFPHIFAMTKDGPAIICDEGVGWVFDENDESNIVSYVGSYTITLDQASRCISTNTTTLENLIGTYNDRYRNNLFIWEGMTEDISQNVLA